LRFRVDDLDEWILLGKREAKITDEILKKALTFSSINNIDRSEGGQKVATIKKGRRNFAYGSVYQRKPEGNWTIDYRGKQGKRVQRVAKHATCWEEAHEALKNAVLKEFYTENGINQRKRNINFRDFSKIFIKDYALITKRSWRADVSRMKALVRHFKDIELREITPLMIERFRLSRLKAGNTKSTANRYLALLKKMLNVAIDEGYLDKNPAMKIKLFSEEDNEKGQALTEDEESKLLAASAEHLRSIIIVALNTGMRPKEIYNLRWNQVDLRKGIIAVERTKSGKVRHIPINKNLYQELLKLKGNESRNPYVFNNPGTGKPYTNTRTAFRAACRRAGISGIRLYDCRHTFASRLAQRGADIETLRTLLGHSSLRMTQRYTHSNAHAKRAAVGLLDTNKWHSCDKLVTNEIAHHSKKREDSSLNHLISWN